jgi:hypothetical protein
MWSGRRIEALADAAREEGVLFPTFRLRRFVDTDLPHLTPQTKVRASVSPFILASQR